MERLEAEFEHGIGDIVYYKNAEHGPGMRPAQQVVISQMAERCHGGVQCFYRLDGRQGWVNQVALVSEMPPYRGVTQQEYDDNRLRTQMRHQSWGRAQEILRSGEE